MSRIEQQVHSSRVDRAHRAFTLIDLMVSIGVVALLISLLLPSLSAVRETTRRVVCSSNQRQIGLGIQMYADTNRGSMPWSAHMGRATGPFGFISNNSPENTMTLRVGLLDRTPRVGAGWDGLGGLYEDHYLRAPEVFYCPSHKGFHGYDKYAANWHDENVSIVGNFQYRALSPRGDRLLSSLADRNLALLSDGLRTQEDFSHKRGANVLRADMSVFWFVDPLDTFSSGLADGEGAVSSSLVESAWSKLDAAAQGN